MTSEAYHGHCAQSEERQDCIVERSTCTVDAELKHENKAVKNNETSADLLLLRRCTDCVFYCCAQQVSSGSLLEYSNTNLASTVRCSVLASKRSLRTASDDASLTYACSSGVNSCMYLSSSPGSTACSSSGGPALSLLASQTVTFGLVVTFSGCSHQTSTWPGASLSTS